jgi:predicted transcriptional regulator
MSHKITIIKVRRTSGNDINKELQWFGNSLGLFNQRDKDSSCFRVFITLIKKAKRNEVISSDQIAEKLRLSRGTVVHHLTKLIDSGIVVREKGGYILREMDLSHLVKNLQKDMEAVISEIQEVAKEIDEKLG